MAIIVFLEDDHLTLKIFKRMLERLSGANPPSYEFVEVYSELDFRRRLAAREFDKADIFVLDANVSWSEASTEKEAPPPQSVDRSDSFAAGLRCASLLLENNPTSSRPIFLFTVTPESRIQESSFEPLLKKRNVSLQPKSENFKAFAHTVISSVEKANRQ